MVYKRILSDIFCVNNISLIIVETWERVRNSRRHFCTSVAFSRVVTFERSVSFSCYLLSNKLIVKFFLKIV